MTLARLTSELEYQSENRRDFIIGTETMAVSIVDGVPRVSFRDSNDKPQSYMMTRHMLSQVAEFTELLPGTRATAVLLDYGSAKEQKALCSYINAVLFEKPKPMGVRTVGRFWEDPKAVAFVDARFKTQSHFATLTNVLGLAGPYELKYAFGNFTDTYMILGLLSPDGTGIVVQHSEVGLKSLVSGCVYYEDDKALLMPTILASQMFDGELTDPLVADSRQSALDLNDDYISVGSAAHLSEDTNLHQFLSEMGLGKGSTLAVIRKCGKTPSHKDIVRAVGQHAWYRIGEDIDMGVDVARIASRIITIPTSLIRDYKTANAKTQAPKRKAAKKVVVNNVPDAGKAADTATPASPAASKSSVPVADGTGKPAPTATT